MHMHFSEYSNACFGMLFQNDIIYFLIYLSMPANLVVGILHRKLSHEEKMKV